MENCDFNLLTCEFQRKAFKNFQLRKLFLFIKSALMPYVSYNVMLKRLIFFSKMSKSQYF